MSLTVVFKFSLNIVDVCTDYIKLSVRLRKGCVAFYNLLQLLIILTASSQSPGRNDSESELIFNVRPARV